MSRDHDWNQHNGRSAGKRKWLEITLFILIGLMICLLACEAVTHRGRSHGAATFGHVEMSDERMKLLFNTH